MGRQRKETNAGECYRQMKRKAENDEREALLKRLVSRQVLSADPGKWEHSLLLLRSRSLPSAFPSVNLVRSVPKQ